MFNLHIQKRRDSSLEQKEHNDFMLELYREEREAKKNEAKLINESRRKHWVAQVLSNSKLKKLLLKDDTLVKEFNWKLRQRRKDQELTDNGFTNYK